MVFDTFPATSTLHLSIFSARLDRRRVAAIRGKRERLVVDLESSCTGIQVLDGSGWETGSYPV